MNSREASPKVLWLQVWGLAAVQGAIALTWVIYNLYLLKLLTQFGFPKGLATGLLILENILAAVMEPLMGGLSDRVQRWVGTRFLFIAVGIVLSSAFFISIPAVVVFGSPVTAIRWVLPGVMVAWALAMTVFRSPALSLLGRYAFATNLPQAASILTLVGGVAGAMAPLAGQFILSLGSVFTFTVGSFTLLGAAAALRFVNPNRSIQQPKPDAPASITPTNSWRQISIPHLGLVFGAGVGVALGFRLMMQTFPRILNTQVPDANKSLILGGIFIAVALTAIPAGTLATRLGNRQAMVFGLLAMAGLTGVMVLTQNGVFAGVIAIAFGATFSLVSNGTIPFALSMVPPDKAGLGTGIYFSGGAVANSVFAGIFSQPDSVSPIISALIGAAAFLAAGFFVAMSGKLTHSYC
ncbi:MFS transporter [Coleofasciculus sp. LEGE 07092]|uniref:MFS transporter n=2 Tax=unclassified Coleofasciculus TaxID=2692782 RepID=UPI00187E171D|nr:MFS transporter [Coleofasciculus sp. LEGE 07092]MBE9126066.1 MFS transporter [Coleofasciculus sp. LEGE 07081]MBE9149479.1 MFS transporter [Coleofasciculus sp. LEGE 07092]